MRIPPTADMSSGALQTLINLMLAQAQECIWQRAAMDQLRDGTIARLAIKIAEFYDAAYELATHSSTQGVFPKPWLTHMQVKALHFNAAAQFRKSCECISQNKYGEEVARLRIANSLVKRAFDMIKSFFSGTPMVSNTVVSDLRSLQQIIQTNLARAEKDNDVIYLETLPSESALPPIQKSEMVKPTPPAEIADPVAIMLANERRGSPHPVIGLPLFQKLVPFAVHQAASVYVDRKERVIKEDIIARLEELTAVYHRYYYAFTLMTITSLTPILCAAQSNHSTCRQHLLVSNKPKDCLVIFNARLPKFVKVVALKHYMTCGKRCNRHRPKTLRC